MVHVQFAGRMHRTGQQRAVTAHYPYVEGGSDPVIMSINGLKASRSEGLINPFGGGLDYDDLDEGRVALMAKAVLEKNGAA